MITALSRREVEILERASEGRSIKEIAQLVCLGRDGVKFHLKNIHAKLGAQRRTEAVRIARDHGLIRPTSREEICVTIIVPASRFSAESVHVYDLAKRPGGKPPSLSVGVSAHPE
ncbi:MAG: response regulator transcription factor [Panacagrimonas sp.]